MKNYYLKSLLLGLMGLTMYISSSQNILFDGDFSVTTEIIPFDGPSPPMNQWAFWVNYYGNGSEANPTVIDGVCNYHIINSGDEAWNVQLAQWGFQLVQGHSYQLSFDVKADSYRSFGVYLGEDSGNWTSLIGYDRYWYYATTEWQTIVIDFKATSIFALHKLSFELGADGTTTYFDNVVLQDLGLASPDKVVIAGTFQDEQGCNSDWDPNCDNTQLTLDSSTGFYTGVFQIPQGTHRYKVTQGGNWDINYGENGLMGGADIYLCIPSGSEDITFIYDPSTHVVVTSPIASGFSPECSLFVVLVGSFQDELGCYGDWLADCTNTALNYNSGSQLFEGDLYIPTGCYDYKVVLDNNWVNNYGQDGIHDGPTYRISIPSNPEMTHFTYDPFNHIVVSTPYGGSSEEVIKVSLVGTLQSELGCFYDYDYGCEYPALLFNPNSGIWEGSFMLPTGCYTYQVKEITVCNNTFYYGENGTLWGNELQLQVPTDSMITFSYDPQSHLLSSSPYSGAPQEVTEVSLTGTFQDELGCAYDYQYDCDNPALAFNTTSSRWEGNFILPSGCYTYQVKETIGCNNVTIYGENGVAWANAIQLYVPSESEITFSYDPQTHIISSTPYSGAPQEVTKVSLMGNLQDELGCTYDNQYECDLPALVFNSNSGAWEGSFELPAGCYIYQVKETSACNTNFYGEGGIPWGNGIQLYLPVDSEITFSYDPQTHIINSTPYNDAPQEVTKVSLYGNLQNELGCAYDFDYECDNPALLFNSDSGAWEGSFTLPAGCYDYRIKETFGCNNVVFYGENGGEWGNAIQLFVPMDSEITFSYDPLTHVISSTPYSGNSQELAKVSLQGTLQDELGCAYDHNYECDNPALTFNSDSGAWEGSFMLPAGCYIYRVKETSGCNNVVFYGENGVEWGNEIQLYVPSDGEITFSYNPQTHIMSSSPYSGNSQELTIVSLIGTLQDELGCANDYAYECYLPALQFNSNSGAWEGSFTLSAGCYSYMVRESFGCNNITLYGENGIQWGNEIQLSIPSDGEIAFSYDPLTHIMSAIPYGGAEQAITNVSLIGTLQDELGCAYDYDYECGNPALMFNADLSTWEGSFTLPAGCYKYSVQQTDLCGNITYYSDNGNSGMNGIQLIVPSATLITFVYDPQTHIINSTPYNGTELGITSISLYGTLQTELGCAQDYDYECDNSALTINEISGKWEGSFTLPIGCYSYVVKETVGCNDTNYYGENGEMYGNFIELYIPSEVEMTFSYDPQTHTMISTPYSGSPQEVTMVSLLGNLQDELGCSNDYDYECDHTALQFNTDLGVWEGNFTLPPGCYSYMVKELFGCNNITFYGENGLAWGNEIQLYVPEDNEMTFRYDPQTHIMSSTPYSGAPQELATVSLHGNLQDELGCADDYDYECNDPALLFNPGSGTWEGSFTLQAGCYAYLVKEKTFGCNNVTLFGENGVEWGNEIQLYLPSDGEMTFSYDPQTHIISSTPYSGTPQEVTKVSLIGTLQDELGCDYDYDDGCDSSALQFNSNSGLWEGSFMLPGGCYKYRVKETFGCYDVTHYGESGMVWGDEIQLYVPMNSEIIFSYNPQTHMMSTTPYSGAPQELTMVSLTGTLQDELGCTNDFDYECDHPALQFNSSSGAWEGSFMLPAGCYQYRVKETFGCSNVTEYGEYGITWGGFIQLYIATDGKVEFSYDPQTHIVSSTPSGGAPEEVTKVSLIGNLQDELGCAADYNDECDHPKLLFNTNSGNWEGSFALPAGCYSYLVKETFSCFNMTLYGENGFPWGNEIQLFVPIESEITFSYDPQTHIVTTTSYTDIASLNECPNTITVNNTPGNCGAILDYPEFVATANCGGDILSITQTAGLPSGSMFPVGMTTNTFLLIKTTGEEKMCSFDVVVNDTEAPVITILNEVYEPLWPPNHKMVPIFIDYEVSDNCGIANTELYISSNEPENGLGDGDMAPDWEIVDEHHVMLRAERSGKGNGREYVITIRAIDGSGNYTEHSVSVRVSSDNRGLMKFVSGSEKLTLYPNPAVDIIHVKGPKSTSSYSYIIYDLLGAIRKEGILQNDQIEIKALSTGLYILKLENGEETFYKKFIIN